MTIEEERSGAETHYRKCYTRLYDSRQTPGVTLHTLNVLGWHVRQAKQDYLAIGGDEQALARIEAQVAREWRLHLTSNEDLIAMIAEVGE